jgi:hypothetical protein
VHAFDLKVHHLARHIESRGADRRDDGLRLRGSRKAYIGALGCKIDGNTFNARNSCHRFFNAANTGGTVHAFDRQLKLSAAFRG